MAWGVSWNVLLQVSAEHYGTKHHKESKAIPETSIIEYTTLYELTGNYLKRNTIVAQVTAETKLSKKSYFQGQEDYLHVIL